MAVVPVPKFKIALLLVIDTVIAVAGAATRRAIPRVAAASRAIALGYLYIIHQGKVIVFVDLVRLDCPYVLKSLISQVIFFVSRVTKPSGFLHFFTRGLR